MRLYLTHCSKEKDPALNGTGRAVTPDKLYTNPDLQQFMRRCQDKKVSWGVLSDRYGIYLSHERHVWYEKHPDTVTPQEEARIIQDFNDRLQAYDEIFFWVRPDTFHPFYERVLNKTVLADKVNVFQNIDCIT